MDRSVGRRNRPNGARRRIGLVPGHVVVPHYDGKRGGWVRAGLAVEPVVLGIPECSGVLVEAGQLRSIGEEASSLFTADGVAGVGFEPT